MRRMISILALFGFALVEHGCLVANTDCESNDDCKSGRVCENGECVGAQGEGGFGGGGVGGKGGSGGSQTFSTCYQCADTRCAEERAACIGDDITFCYSLLKCMDECSTSSCSSQCGVEWTGDLATSNLYSCVAGQCPICTN